MENLRYFVVVNTYNNRQYQPIDVSFFADGVRCVTYDDFGGEDVFLKNGEFEIEWIDVPIDKRTEAEYEMDVEKQVLKAQKDAELFHKYQFKVEKDMQEEYPEHFKCVEFFQKIAEKEDLTLAIDIILEYFKNRDISGMISPEDADKLFIDFNEFVDTHNWFFFNSTFACEVTFYPSQRHHPEEYTAFIRNEIRKAIEGYEKKLKDEFGIGFSDFFRTLILRRVYHQTLHKKWAEYHEKNI